MERRNDQIPATGDGHRIHRVRPGVNMKKQADKIMAVVLLLTVSFFAHAVILG